MKAQMKPVALRRIRETRGWTKSDLARETRMQAGTIGWIEEGRFVPYQSQIENIARALGIEDPDTLLEQED